MDQQELNGKITSFWKWFVSYKDRIKLFFTEEELIDKEALIESINNQVLEFGLFSWEIGPGNDKPYYFTISPNGDRKRLELSKRIMKEAPELSEWEFHPAKQAVNWNWAFSVYDSFMQERQIDASNWNYVLWKQPTGGMTLILEAPNISHLDEDTKRNAGDLVLTKAIGEEIRIKYISRLEIADELEEIYHSRRFPIHELAKRVR